MAHLPFHAITFSCGWDQKNLHTMFDYVVRSLKNDLVAGKSIASWCLQLCGEIIGGYPPMMEDISTDKEKISAFFHLLFDHQENIEMKVKHIRAATILRFHNQFLDLIKMDPKERFEDPNNHRFALKVNTAAHDAGEFLMVMS